MAHYTGHILFSGSGANAAFSSVPVANYPDMSFQHPAADEKTIFLAGGFPSIQPNSLFPLSPTLQLNGDLTDMDAKNLAALARTEFTRYSSQSYRSYSLEADPRVTILSSDSHALHTFIDTYGGVLQTTPILLKGYDPHLSTAEEIQITAVSDGFRIDLTVKQAVDTSRCTYCGACGAVCPKHCLDERLFLDFSSCSYCQECLAVCSHDAIDLYRVEHRELSTPALLILNDTSVTLPKSRKNCFFESSLPDLFASIFPSEVEEAISWDASSCQYSARLKTGCSTCVDACSGKAVTQNRSGVQIDHLACIECGSCLGSCPTGSLHYRRFDDVQFVQYFRTFPLPAGSVVVLADEQTLHRHWWYSGQKRRKGLFFMEFPQPAALNTFHFLFLFAMGARQVVILGETDTVQNRQIDLSNMILRKLFGQECVVYQTADTFKSLSADTSFSPLLHTFYHDFSFTNRREKLADLLCFLRMQSVTESAIIQDVMVPDFGRILCNREQCTQCGACVNECRTGALTADGDQYTLNHTPALCVQCGICIAICPENCLAAENGLFLEDTFFKESVMAQAEPARCKECGKIFGTRKSLEKVIAILAAKNMWDGDDDLLSYCDSCRVVNLYESGKQV